MRQYTLDMYYSMVLHNIVQHRHLEFYLAIVTMTKHMCDICSIIAALSFLT